MPGYFGLLSAGLKYVGERIGVLFGTTPGTVAPGEKLPGPHPIDTTGAVNGDSLVYNSTSEQYEPAVGSGGLQNPLTANLDADGFRILDLGAPTAQADAVRLQDLQASRGAIKCRGLVILSSLPANNVDTNAGTITGVSNGALGTHDGLTFTAGQIVFVAATSSSPHTGPYEVTRVGDGSTTFLLTRSPYFNTDAKAIPGTIVYVSEGTTYGDRFFYLTTNDTITLGSTSLDWASIVVGPLRDNLNFATWEATNVARVAGSTGAALQVEALGTGDLLLRAGGSTRVTINDGGNVDIEDGATLRVLETTGSIAQPVLTLDASNNAFVAPYASGRATTTYYGGLTLYLAPNGVPVLRAFSDGYVHLGATDAATSGSPLQGARIPYGGGLVARNEAGAAWSQVFFYGTYSGKPDALLIGSDVGADIGWVRIYPNDGCRISPNESSGSGALLEVEDGKGVTLNGALWRDADWINGTTTISATDGTELYYVDASGGILTINLPAVASCEGRVIGFKCTGSANNVTIDANSTELIDGATTKVINTYQFVKLHAVGAFAGIAAKWHIIASG